MPARTHTFIKRFYKDELYSLVENRSWWFKFLYLYYDEYDVSEENPDMNGVQIHGITKDVAIYGISMIFKDR